MKDGNLTHEEWKLHSKDPKYFIENFIYMDDGKKMTLKDKPHQRNAIDSIHTNNNTIINAPRQSGKSLVGLAYIAWYCVFKVNRMETYLSKYHINVFIVSNTFEKSIRLIEQLRQMLINLRPEFKVEFKNSEKHRFKLKNGITVQIGTTRSQNCDSDVVFWDEFAHFGQSKDFFNANFPILVKRKGKIIINSTPDGIDNEFYHQWQKATKGVSKFNPIRWDWRDCFPVGFKEEVIKNITYKDWLTEYECQFIPKQVIELLKEYKSPDGRYSNFKRTPRQLELLGGILDLFEGVSYQTTIDILNDVIEEASKRAIL